MGYVGLPIALEFAKKISVIGFDINAERIEMMKNGIDPSKELEKEAFEDCDIEFTNIWINYEKQIFLLLLFPHRLMNTMFPILFLYKKQVKQLEK